MACNSPPSPAVWENNNSNSNNNNSSNSNSSNTNSSSDIKNIAMLDTTSRGQGLCQPPADSSPAYMEEYTHHNWYHQQGAHLGLQTSGPTHHASAATSATQSLGAVYWSMDPAACSLAWAVCLDTTMICFLHDLELCCAQNHLTVIIRHESWLAKCDTHVVK